MTSYASEKVKAMVTKSVSIRVDEDTVESLDILAHSFYDNNRTALILDLIEKYIDSIVINDEIKIDELPLDLSMMLYQKLYNSLHIRSLKLWTEIQGTRARIKTDYAKKIRNKTLKKQSLITQENDKTYLKTLTKEVEEIHKKMKRAKRRFIRLEKKIAKKTIR